MLGAGPKVEPITAVVVAGGKSVRLGEDKRRLRLWGSRGPTLLEHTVRLMAERCDEVVVALNDPEDWTELPARLARDIYPEGGSLGGIYTGLQVASHPYIFAVAADMPLLDAALIDWMIREPRDYDVLAPKLTEGKARNRLGVESLHAIYGENCRVPIRRQLEAGNPQVIGFFPHVRVRILEPATLREFDPDGVGFKNINTPDDLAEVRRLLDRRPI